MENHHLPLTKIFFVNFICMCVTFSGFYMSDAFAFHAQLGITDNEAANLYKLNPNDPAIKSWKDALEQNIATNQRLCFDTSTPLSEGIKHSCDNELPGIYKDCKSHPNILLSCVDPRIGQWVTKMGTVANSSNLAN
jgi:hypothetical protein